MIRKGIRQSFRTPVRLIIYFLVTALVCTFLCIGLNLKKASDGNLESILDNFNMLALPDFKAQITENGGLATSQFKSIGYFPCKAENYDLNKLLELPGVIKIDARNQFGACINNHENKLFSYRASHHVSLRYDDADVVIFQYSGDEPYIIKGYEKVDGKSIYRASQTSFPVKFLWSAAGRNMEYTSLTVLNSTYTPITLEPDKVYIANIGHHFSLLSDIYHDASKIYINNDGGYYWEELDDRKMKYPALVEYYEGFWDTDIGKYYRQSAEACYLNGNSLTAITTSDLTMIPSWANGDVYLKKGSAFSEDDYQNGNKVCIVSEQFLNRMGWSIGDTIDFSFYETSYLLNKYIRNQYSTFDPYLYDTIPDVQEGNTGSFPLDHIFDEGTYTIIGAYNGNVCWKKEHDSELFNECMHWAMVLIPSTSVQNQPEVKLSQYMTSIKVEPMMIQKFLAAAQASGLMDEQTYGYQLGLTIDDHGLSEMISGLESLQQISRLTLMLASITAVLAVLVLAILHLLQNRKQIAVLRSMGVRKGQVTACVLAGILLVCILGAALGAWCGEKLSEAVTQRILDTAREESMDSSFSAMLAIDDDETDDFQLSAAADPRLTYWTAGLVSAAMILVSSALVLWEAKKPPLLMLGVKE